jgi:hypothetical protein
LLPALREDEVAVEGEWHDWSWLFRWDVSGWMRGIGVERMPDVAVELWVVSSGSCYRQ